MLRRTPIKALCLSGSDLSEGVNSVGSVMLFHLDRELLASSPTYSGTRREGSPLGDDNALYGTLRGRSFSGYLGLGSGFATRSPMLRASLPLTGHQNGCVSPGSVLASGTSFLAISSTPRNWRVSERSPLHAGCLQRSNLSR